MGASSSGRQREGERKAASWALNGCGGRSSTYHNVPEVMAHPRSGLRCLTQLAHRHRKTEDDAEDKPISRPASGLGEDGHASFLLVRCAPAKNPGGGFLAPPSGQCQRPAEPKTRSASLLEAATSSRKPPPPLRIPRHVGLAFRLTPNLL